MLQSLRSKLTERPAAEELSARGILMDPSKMDPSLQQAAKSLEMHMKADQVSGKLQARPTMHELGNEGVLRKDLNGVAPALHGKALALEKEIKKDSLAKALNKRPELGQLQAHHIVTSPSKLSHSLASAAHTLEHQMTADKLAQKLRERPSADKLRKGIMSPSVA